MQRHARRCERRLTVAASGLLRVGLVPQPCAAVRKALLDGLGWTAASKSFMRQRARSGQREHHTVNEFVARIRQACRTLSCTLNSLTLIWRARSGWLHRTRVRITQMPLMAETLTAASRVCVRIGWGLRGTSRMPDVSRAAVGACAPSRRIGGPRAQLSTLLCRFRLRPGCC